MGFSDPDMVVDLDDRKSTLGVSLFLGRRPTSWQSQKQRVVALSSCEAEYTAGSTAACQGIWLALLIGELLNQNANATKIFIDNKSAISHRKNPGSKHIDLRYHFIRDNIENRRVLVEFIRFSEQLADNLTKPLAQPLLGDVLKDRHPRRQAMHLN